MPHDSGVSRCRNALVARAKQKFLLLCDDDFRFGAETDVPAALSIVRADPELGVLGGSLIEEEAGHPDCVRHWELSLHLDERNRTLTAVPIYHYLPEPRYVGVHKYYLCDAVMNFAVLRRAVFDDPAVRWDPRFTCNGEHEDFFLNFKRASPYRVAYFPGLRARHHHDHDGNPVYERLRRRSEGWRLFLEKWGIEQYCELDNGTRTVSEPGTLHKKRHWGTFLSEIDLSGAAEWSARTHGVSLTDDGQVILARHYDPDEHAIIPSPQAAGTVFLDRNNELHATVATSAPTVPDASAVLADVARAGSDVRLAFHAAGEVREGDEMWIAVQVHNDGNEPLCVGPDSPVRASFSARWRRGGAYVAFQDGSTDCYADLPIGVHEQVVSLRAPSAVGSFELEIALVVGDALILGEPASARVLVRARGEKAAGPAAAGMLAAGGPAAPAPSFVDKDARLSWIRDHVRLRPLQGDATASDSHLAVEIDCAKSYDETGISEILVTHHWKRGEAYVAWDVHRHVLSGLRRGRQIRTIPLERPADPALSLEVAALVPMAGYVRLFSENEVERMAGE
jgi:hypothetical protein